MRNKLENTDSSTSLKVKKNNNNKNKKEREPDKSRFGESVLKEVTFEGQITVI